MTPLGSRPQGQRTLDTISQSSLPDRVVIRLKWAAGGARNPVEEMQDKKQGELNN